MWTSQSEQVCSSLVASCLLFFSSHFQPLLNRQQPTCPAVKNTNKDLQDLPKVFWWGRVPKLQLLQLMELVNIQEINHQEEVIDQLQAELNPSYLLPRGTEDLSPSILFPNHLQVISSTSRLQMNPNISNLDSFQPFLSPGFSQQVGSGRMNVFHCGDPS